MRVIMFIIIIRWNDWVKNYGCEGGLCNRVRYIEDVCGYKEVCKVLFYILIFFVIK